MLNRIPFELLAGRPTLVHQLYVGVLVKAMLGNDLLNLCVEGRLVHPCYLSKQNSRNCLQISGWQFLELNAKSPSVFEVQSHRRICREPLTGDTSMRLSG